MSRLGACFLNTFGDGPPECTHVPNNRAMSPSQIDYVVCPSKCLQNSNAVVVQDYYAASDHFAVHAIVSEGDRTRRMGTTGRPPTSLFGWKCHSLEKFQSHAIEVWKGTEGVFEEFVLALAQVARCFARKRRKRRVDSPA
eukprot:6359597-Alexandrium_andersonii.AAC.1